MFKLHEHSASGEPPEWLRSAADWTSSIGIGSMPPRAAVSTSAQRRDNSVNPNCPAKDTSACARPAISAGVAAPKPEIPGLDFAREGLEHLFQSFASDVARERLERRFVEDVDLRIVVGSSESWESRALLRVNRSIVPKRSDHSIRLGHMRVHSGVPATDDILGHGVGGQTDDRGRVSPAWDSSVRIARVADSTSMTGICRSMRMTAKRGPARTAATAAAPSETTVTAWAALLQHG